MLDLFNKVRSLEAANQKLELQIQEFYAKKSPVNSKDMTVYFDTMAGLRKQLKDEIMEHAQISLQVDNARLAADDFKMKYESELSIRMSVEGDMGPLRGLLDGFTLSRSELELKVEGLTEEEVFIKKDHEEDMQQMRSQQGGAVNVEMECASSADLNQELLEIRQKYEALVLKNQREAEEWFRRKEEMLQSQIMSSNTEVKTSRSELGDLKMRFQALEIELQGLHTEKQHMEQSAAETNGRYGARLNQLQLRINSLEEELQQLNASTQQQSSEYQLLLNIKMRLELEIAEYRRLLDGEGTSSLVVSTTKQAVQEVEQPENNLHLEKREGIIVEEVNDGDLNVAEI